MNLDDLSVAVRERTLPEIYDLALVLARRHAGRLLLLALAGAAPFVALDALLLAGAEGGDGTALTWLAVLLATQAPIATAPLAAYLGEAMFSRAPTVRGALATARGRLGALLVLALHRGAFLALPVALAAAVGHAWIGLVFAFLLMFYPLHAVEVVLLERQPLGPSLRRAHQLMGSWRSDAIGHLAVGALVVVLGVVVAAVSGALLIDLLFTGAVDLDAWPRWFDPARSWLPLLLPWPFIAWLAVARFLAYIDLRTRREGWEIEIELRRAGRRLAPAGEG